MKRDACREVEGVFVYRGNRCGDYKLCKPGAVCKHPAVKGLNRGRKLKLVYDGKIHPPGVFCADAGHPGEVGVVIVVNKAAGKAAGDGLGGLYNACAGIRS